MLESMACVPHSFIAEIANDFMDALVAQKIKAGVYIVPCGVCSIPTLAFPDSVRILKSKFLYIRYSLCGNRVMLGILMCALHQKKLSLFTVDGGSMNLTVLCMIPQ